MANTKTAQQNISLTARRTAINKSRMSRIRTFVKAVEHAIEAGKADDAKKAFIVAQPELQRGVTKGIVHKNTASRKLSRLSARIKALA
jgi:small subunit ribosomal protein S20